jgi:membrane protease YdiL (CAAX protease family)
VDTSSVSISELVVQVLAFVGLAFAAVGLGFRRTFQEASARLGLIRPTLPMVGIAIAATFLGFVINGAASAATQHFQPDVYDKLEQVTQQMTADVSNPIGALILGLSAGIGEELLLRGAVQPRFGILLTSLLFALLHVQYGLAYVLIGLFLTGVVLGLERRYFGTTTAIMTHALFDAVVVLAQAAR